MVAHGPPGSRSMSLAHPSGFRDVHGEAPTVGNRYRFNVGGSQTVQQISAKKEERACRT